MLKVKFHHLVEGTPSDATKDERFELIKNLELSENIDMLFKL
jgi:hypothetical protein